MREEEKIFAGKLFNNQCAELRAIKRKSHAANQRYNRLDDMLESTGVEKCKLCTYCWDGQE